MSGDHRHFLGAAIAAIAVKEFRANAGSAPACRFMLGIFVTIGAPAFLGCSLRQLILAGEDNGDSAVTVLGMITGAAVFHSFSLASNADSMADGSTWRAAPAPPVWRPRF